MPVLPIINEGVKMGLKFTPGAPAEVVGAITTLSQVAMSAPAIQIVGIVPVPVLPVGAPASFALTQLEAMLYKTYEIISKIIQTLINQYQKDYKDAVIKAIDAEKKLYADLLEAQENIIEEVIELESTIQETNDKLQKTIQKQNEEKIRYENTVFEYTENARAAELEGDFETRNEWTQKIADLEGWLADIILMVVEIINLRMELMSLENQLNAKKPLTEITITNDWDTNVNLATDFLVPVPYRPDLPDVPSLPEVPPLPQIPELVKALLKAFAKWINSPQVPPIGIAVSAIFVFLMSLIPANTPPTSAKMEAQADAFLLQLGGCI